jgi:hypothetical protein
MIARTCVACYVQGPAYGIAFANENTRKIEVNTAFLQRIQKRALWSTTHNL